MNTAIKLRNLPLPKGEGKGEGQGEGGVRVAESARQRGQATTEVVLLLPILLFFLFAFMKVFALLVLVQKLEIASFYAARRWQLESHRNVDFMAADGENGCAGLCANIRAYARCYLGVSEPGVCPGTPGFQSFLGIEPDGIALNITRQQVWNEVTLTVKVRALTMPAFKVAIDLPTLQVKKFVPNRDRPIAYVLPGLKE